MTIKLTLKQEKFCQEYISNGGNASAAYRAAYDTAKMKEETVIRNACQLLKNNNITTRLKELKKQLNKKYEVTQERVITELARIAFFDSRQLFDDKGKLKKISDLDDDTAAVIAAVDVSDEGLKKIKLADKNSSLEKLCKHLGLYEKDNKQQAVQIVSMGSIVIGEKPLQLKVGKDIQTD